MTVDRDPMAVDQAKRNVKAAERKLAEAQDALSHARYELDAALARVGWKRVQGAFSSDVRYYTHAAFPDATLDLDGVLKQVEHLRRALA